MLDDFCDFKIKTKNSDFLVTEVPLLPDIGSSPQKYTYLWLKKSNYTTFEALEKIKAFYNLDFSDVCAEGLKDEDGITEQIISVNKKITKKSVNDFNLTHAGEETFISFERIIGYGAEPVTAKALHGNTFRVIVRNLTEEEARLILDYVKSNKFFSFVNYYDNQRFGLPGGPYLTHLIGKAICEEKWDEAFELMKKSGNEIPEGKTGKAAFETINPGRVKFYISAYNSYLWNKAVSDYLGTDFKSQLHDFPNVGELNLPLSAQAVPTGIFTVPGYHFDLETFSAVESDFGRNIILPTTVYCGQPKDDEIFADKKCVLLSFFLHTGCYATMMVKQIIKTALEKGHE